MENETIEQTGLSKDDQWYVIQVLSGYENRVKERILSHAETDEMRDVIKQVLVPMENVSEVKRGKRKNIKKKFFPGYIIVNMKLYDDEKNLIDRVWYFIRETDGVIGFAGSRDKPAPLKEAEVKILLAQMQNAEERARPKVEFEVGDTVKVSDGPFQNQSGIVEEIDPERGKLRVTVTIFGRATPVDLEYWQAERVRD